MLIHDIFTSFFVEDNLDIDNDAIVNFCENNIKKDCTNTGHIAFDQQEFQDLLEAVYQRTNAIQEHLGISSNYEQYIWKYWGNMNITYDIGSAHCHPESFLSCVYYAKADNKSGQLEFINPVTQIQPVVQDKMIDTYTRYVAKTWIVDPIPGKLIIFPSWLWHFVTRNESSCNRISIALDTKIRLKNDTT